MQISQARKRQLLAFTVVVYGLTIYSVYDATVTSISFLQTVIKLTEGFNFIIICLFVLLNSVLMWRLSTFVLFGRLRLIEYEHILERLPFTLINTILMTSMFKEQDFFTVMLFGFLLIYVKVFHWILRDRLDGLLQNMQETTKIYGLIISRFTLNMAILFYVDFQVVAYCIKKSLSNNFGSSTAVVLMIGMEFLMLVIDLSNIFLHSSLNFYEFYRAQGANNVVNVEANEGNGDETEQANDVDDNQFTGLEGKFLYERIIDIFTRLLKTIVHCLMLVPLKMPVMLMKDIVWDCITLYQNITMVWKTWRNNKQLNDRLPTITEDELKTLDIDNICIICMDELINEERPHRRVTSKYQPKRLPCGHVLHLCCLKNWMERSQTCPICRLPVFDENGGVLPSRITTASSTARSENELNINIPFEQLPTRTVDPADDSAQDAVEEHGQQQYRHRGTTSTTWYPFPIEGTADNSIHFTLQDSKNERQVPVKLVVDKTQQRTKEDENTEYGMIQKVIIPDEYTHHNQTIDSLKRRISELENQVQDLNKRVRKD